MKKQIFFIALALVIIGAGCKSTKEKDGGTTQISQQPEAVQTLVKKPRNLPPIEQAYTFCESQGYNVLVSYDEISQKNRISCVFEDNTKCDIVDYYKNTCGPGKNGRLSLGIENNNLIKETAYCDDASPTVCGVDGKNYTNQCVASQLAIGIAHEGLCTEKEKVSPLIPEDPSAVYTTQPQQQAEKTQSTQGQTGQPRRTVKNPDWLSIVYSTVKAQPKNNPRSKVERCSYSENTYYLYSESCEDCFSTLYFENGSVACFPSNDITYSCPTEFVKNNRATNCSRIWKDNR